ncbi:MAG: tetratricopeptide repeat protein [Actinobacteria bacterium]|nr:tetratricopeptide repeat protein [Actinomycetota bacterium]
MLARYRSGSQADALAAYQDARRTLGEELGLEPGPELKKLERAILRHDSALTVDPAELKARRRLPAPATALVGRRRDVDDLTELARGDARLVTLTGPGGTGKTRVAIQAAHELADAFPDGVVFVGLAGLRDAELVASEIVAALGVEDGTRPAAESLAEHLREKTVLLLMDNFEQVDAAAPALGALLAAAPALRLLVTSRHPLRIDGEHEFPVPPLVEDEAVALFVARARAVKRGFEASAAVPELCLLLDRLPLAIELAAARVRELSPDEMLTDLPRRLELAAGGPRDAPARHQTLWATIDWSFVLLDVPARTLFARLAVFVGGFAVEAAATVCDADGALIEELVEKNLLFESGGRVALLETVREYALERLDGLGESTVRRRHADHYLSLVLAGKEVRRDPREVEWMDRLEADRENVRAAFAFLLEQDPEAAARLADGAYRFWYIRAHFEEGLRAFERVLDLGDLLTPRDRANALTFSAAFAFGRRDLVRARTLAEEALEWQRRLGELDSIARALVLVGTVRSEVGDHEEAVVALEESVELARRHGDVVVLSLALAHLVMATVNGEMYDRTRELGEEALATTRSAGDVDSEATVLGSLGTAALRRGDRAEAAERFSAALAANTERGDPVGMLDYVEGIAAVAAVLGEPESAARLLGAAEALEAARDIPLEATSLRTRAETLAALREALGEEELRARWKAGAALTLEAAAEQAAQLAGRLGPRSPER